MGSQQGAEAALTERERELLDLYAPMVTGGRVLNGRAQARQVRDAHPALVADYAARLDALVASLTAARQHAEYWERAFKGAHSRATAARQREQQLTQALTEISLHQVLSPESDKGQVCDWHCTARLVEIAASVLAGEAPPTAPPGNPVHDGCYDGCAACQDRVASRLAHLLREWDAGEALPPPTPAALEKHAARFGPAGVVETATEFGLDIDVSAAIPVRRPRRRRR